MGGNGRAGFLGGGGGAPPFSPPSLISDKLTTGNGGFSGGTSAQPPTLVAHPCLAGRGGGRSSPDDELSVDATLFCDGEEQTPPRLSPLYDGRLTVDDRLASDLSGRLAVNCCVNSMTTVGEDVDSDNASWPTVSDDDEASSE